LFCRQSTYPPPSARSIGKSSLYSGTNHSSSSRFVSNTMGLPPTFRTFHANQQPIPPFRPMYPSQVPPFRMNHPWANMANEPVGAMTNNNGLHVEKNRARSADTGPRNHLSIHPANFQHQSAPVIDHHHRPRAQPTNNVVPSAENGKEQNVSTV
jgi:hypothetical protein